MRVICLTIVLLLLCSAVFADAPIKVRFKQTVFKPPSPKRSIDASTSPAIVVQFLSTLKVSLDDAGIAAFSGALQQAAVTGLNCTLLKTVQTGRDRTFVIVECTFPPGGLLATNQTARKALVFNFIKAALAAAVIEGASADSTPLAIEEDIPVVLKLPAPARLMPEGWTMVGGQGKKKRAQIVQLDNSTGSSSLPPYIELGAPWHLDRIDSHPDTLDGFYGFYGNGTGHTGYIIDTGVQDHPEFDPPGRVVGLANTLDGSGPTDCNGHGTHVAGILAGIYVGVAKGAHIRVVKALDCSGSGTTSSVVAALYLIDDDALNVRPGDPNDPFVINLSLNGPMSQSMIDAVNILNSAHRVSIVAAAGNAASGACNTAPAAISGVTAVGATTSTDQLASFSNYGSCVPWYAPGVSVTSAWLGGLYAVLSGTSMASPVKAGIDLIVSGQFVDSGFILADGDNFILLMRQTCYDQRTVVQSLDRPLVYAAFDASSANNYGVPQPTPPPPPGTHAPPSPDGFPPAPPPVLLIAPPIIRASDATSMRFIAAYVIIAVHALGA